MQLAEVEGNSKALEWQVSPLSQPNIFESASPPTDIKRVHQGAYYFSQLNLKMRLDQAEHFCGTR